MYSGSPLLDKLAITSPVNELLSWSFDCSSLTAQLRLIAAEAARYTTLHQG